VEEDEEMQPVEEDEEEQAIEEPSQGSQGVVAPERSVYPITISLSFTQS
jgi:hypothetical protein